ncbi:MAG TPA: [FeFe] hydrogenase H-cluster radical SAM maturase HydE [Prolixibacteraceae bacterium]
MVSISTILEQSSFSHSDLEQLLLCEGDEKRLLFKKSGEIKEFFVGNKVYFRGLIEFSNVCDKDCYYCGIRKSNHTVRRYNLTDAEILEAAHFADENKFGSVVLQSGENSSSAFAGRITHLVRQIKQLSNGRLGITLSVGEQQEEVYRQWFEEGAHRYLLRIETTNQSLYHKIHPDSQLHDFNHRLDCLNSLREIGYQTGTGVMIGLPFQTIGDLANDLLFFQQFGIDMVGMGPYIEHSETPLYEFRHELLPIQERFDLSLKMIAVLRILMKDINIAAATALQAIDPLGREKGIKVGANIIMPNITPGLYRNDYSLYENKPCVDEEPAQCKGCLDARIALADGEIGYGEWGDSKHFMKNKGKN